MLLSYTYDNFRGGLEKLEKWIMSESEIVRIENCQNRKLSETEIVIVSNYHTWYQM